MGKAHLESLELQRKDYVRARAFAMAQRSSLYARDELEMAVMRIRIRHPNEPVAPHEEAFKLQPPEVPVRNKVCDCILQQTLAHANHGHILALQPSKIPTNGA